MLETILNILVALYLFLMATMLTYYATGGRIFKLLWHDLFGHHIPDHSKDHFMGINECSVCKICGKKIMQDSQGNWF